MDLEEFEGLIDDYQFAQESGKYKARVDARIALKDAWRGLEAERDALRKDAERMAFLADKSAQLIACPCEVGPEVMWAVCGEGIRALGWFASQRAAIDAAIAAKEPK